MAEMVSLFRGQWKNGLLPSIVFNTATDEAYFPGPAFWKTHTSKHAPDSVPTTGIVQPPIHAIAVLKVYQRAQDKQEALQFLHKLYPKLVKWHQYLYQTRDPHKEGLCYIRHMWESGMDDSPAWQESLKRMRFTKAMIPSYQRVDAAKVNETGERPTDFFYDRAVYLIKMFYDNDYKEDHIFDNTPFAIQDVLFNSILARAGEALSDIATILGFEDEASDHLALSKKTANAISTKLYDPIDGFFYDYDLIGKKSIRVKISGGFVSLYGASVTKHQMKRQLDLLLSGDFVGKEMTTWTIPSVSLNDPSYSNISYWRGPAWLNINYLVRDGLLRNKLHDERASTLAKFLKERSLELLREHGFYEYFSPIDGSPHGGHSFSWSAALALDWMCEGNRSKKNSSNVLRSLLLPNGLGVSVAIALIAASVVTMLRSSILVDDSS